MHTVTAHTRTDCASPSWCLAVHPGLPMRRVQPTFLYISTLAGYISTMKADPEDPERCPACPGSGPPVPPPRPAPLSRHSPNASTSTSPTAGQPGSATTSAREVPSSPWFAASRPQPSSEPQPAAEAPADEEATLHWIACSGCGNWYHGACVLQGSEELQASVPEEVRTAVGPDGEWAAEGVWAEWVTWMDKWSVIVGHVCDWD